MSNLQFPSNHPSVVLAVDTSRASASFAISYEGRIIASHQSDASISHSKAFFNSLSLLLLDAGLSLKEIDVFAAAVGPGSFTGLRVGLSAIKGISQGLEKLVVGVSSIDALALTSEVTGDKTSRVLVLIEAGREEVYAGLREISTGKMLKSLDVDTVGKLPDVIRSFNKNLMKDQLIIVGRGDREIPLSDLPLNWRMGNSIITTAEAIATYIGKTFKGQPDLGLRPYYIRLSDAEIKRAN